MHIGGDLKAVVPPRIPFRLNHDLIGPTIGVIRIICRRPETNVGAAGKIDAQEVVAEDLIATNGVSIVGGTENENADGAIVCDAVARAVPGNDVCFSVTGNLVDAAGKLPLLDPVEVGHLLRWSDARVKFVWNDFARPGYTGWTDTGIECSRVRIGEERAQRKCRRDRPLNCRNPGYYSRNSARRKKEAEDLRGQFRPVPAFQRARGRVHFSLMKVQQMGKAGLFSILLIGTAMSLGCRMIASVINLGLTILPVILLISIEDGSEVERIVSVPLDRGEIRQAAAPATPDRPDYSIEVRDAAQSPTGGSATIVVRHSGVAGEPVFWERVVEVPLHGVVETNVFASLKLTCRIVEPPAPGG